MGNRVAAIQELLPDTPWKHVKSASNPADILSRGSTIPHLETSTLWWNDPPCLQHPEDEWPPPQFTAVTDLPETKAVVLLAPPSPQTSPFWDTYSSFTHLVRIYAWIRCFTANIRLPKNERRLSPQCQDTRRLFFGLIQQEYFPEARRAIKKKSTLHKSQALAGFNLSLAEDGLLLVS